MATYDELLRQMQGHIEYFGSPETYARTIKYKEAKGHELSDPASAALFQTMYPALFETSTTPTRSMGVSTDPLYKAIQQIQQPVPVAAPPTPQYQTPEQLAALMQTWMGAMQPYVDIQTRQAQEATGQLMQRLAGQWGASGLAASPGLAVTQAEEARRMAETLAGIQAAAQQEALGRALHYAQLGLAEQEQLWRQGFDMAQMQSQQRQSAAQLLAQALGLDISQHQWAREFPVMEAGVTGTYRGKPTIEGQRFGWEQLLGRMEATGALPEMWGGGPTWRAQTWEKEYEQRERQLEADIRLREQALAAEWARIDLQRGLAVSPEDERKLEQTQTVLGMLMEAMKDYRSAKTPKDRLKVHDRTLEDFKIMYGVGGIDEDLYTRASAWTNNLMWDTEVPPSWFQGPGGISTLEWLEQAYSKGGQR